MRSIVLFSCFLALISCSNPPVVLKTGTWKGTLDIQGHQLPFIFDIEKKGESYQAFLHNDTERILLDEISVKGDSVIMLLHVFDAALKAKIDDETLTGTFVKNYAPEANMPFSAKWGEDYKFTSEKSAAVDFTGKYDVTFFTPTDTTKSVGIFKQGANNVVTGTFLNTNGDYRYLDGNIVGQEMQLSTFDGNHAFLFTATKSGDTLRGEFFSGKSSHETWVGVKNDNAVLTDTETATFLKKGFDKIDFSFPDLNGNKVSPSDEKYRNKVLVLQIFGTWCPNCMDETKFLAPWYDQNKSRGVEILGLAYERKDDFNYARDRVEKMKAKWNVNYDFVIAGVNDKAKASETLPMLNRVVAFPTTIFIGKDGKVKKIHTGFSGPGTGIYYEQLTQEFNETINELLNEKSTSSIN